MIIGIILWWVVFFKLPRFAIPVLVVSCVLSSYLFDFLIRSRKRVFGLLLTCTVITTCVTSSFAPLHSLLGRIRTGDWTRSSFYGIPSIIDKLPEGSTVLNLSSEATGDYFYNHFALAGKHLSNRVIPAFEVPSELSTAFILQEKVDYVVTRELIKPELAGLANIALDLFYDERQDASTTVKRGWKLWRVIRPIQSAKGEKHDA